MKTEPGKNIKTLYGMKIAILGFDREGTSTYRFLEREPEFRGAEIWILDKNKDVEIPKGVHARLAAATSQASTSSI